MWSLAYFSNSRLGWNGEPGANALAYSLRRRKKPVLNRRMKTGNDEFIEKVLENLMEKIIGTVKTELVTMVLNTSSSSIT